MDIQFTRQAANNDRHSHQHLDALILPILAVYKDGTIESLGVGWVIAIFGRRALILTATHLFDYINRKSDLRQSHSTMPSDFRVFKERDSVPKTTLYALRFLPDGKVETLLLTPVWFNRDYDVAAGCVTFRNDSPETSLFVNKIGIDSSHPRVGTAVFTRTIVKTDGEIRFDHDRDAFVGEIGFKGMSRQGVITEILPSATGHTGRRNQIGFRTNIPFDSGMSGSPIFALDGSVTPACGIVSSDISVDDSAMGAGDGTSFGSALWPAMPIPIWANTFGLGEKGSEILMLELERRKIIHDVGRASEHITVVTDELSGATTIKWTGKI